MQSFSGLLIAYGGDLTGRAKKSVVEAFFGCWHGQIVELGEKVHDPGATRASGILEILQPHGKTPES